MPLIALLGHISSVAIDKWSKADEAVSGIEPSHPLQFQLLSRLILLEIRTVAANPLYHLELLSNLQNYSQHGASRSTHGRLPLTSAARRISMLIARQVGTGEYTTGFVGGGASKSDKKVGVVGLTLFDLRRRGKVGKLSMVGTSGGKFPAIRESHSI